MLTTIPLLPLVSIPLVTASNSGVFGTLSGTGCAFKIFVLHVASGWNLFDTLRIYFAIFSGSFHALSSASVFGIKKLSSSSSSTDLLRLRLLCGERLLLLLSDLDLLLLLCDLLSDLLDLDELRLCELRLLLLPLDLDLLRLRFEPLCFALSLDTSTIDAGIVI